MKKVIRLDEKEEDKKPVEFLECYSSLSEGWEDTSGVPYNFDFILYRETIDRLDYFIAYNSGDEVIEEFRGHLNSGEY